LVSFSIHRNKRRGRGICLVAVEMMLKKNLVKRGTWQMFSHSFILHSNYRICTCPMPLQLQITGVIMFRISPTMRYRLITSHANCFTLIPFMNYECFFLPPSKTVSLHYLVVSAAVLELVPELSLSCATTLKSNYVTYWDIICNNGSSIRA